MALKLMGKKRGMTQLFDESGQIVVCTIIEVEPNVITQLKTKEADGYTAIQLGFEKVTAKDPRRAEARTNGPQRGHFKKNNIHARRYLIESRIDNIEEYTLGQEISVSAFAHILYVDVIGISKGKGFQGVMKKFNMKGGPAAHGSGFHRHMGSTGMRSTPGRCLPNGPRPSHMGSERVTTQNLRVILIIEEDNLLLIEGSVPGANGDLVFIQEAVKRPKKQTKSSGVKLWQQ